MHRGLEEHGPHLVAGHGIQEPFHDAEEGMEHQVDGMDNEHRHSLGMQILQHSTMDN